MFYICFKVFFTTTTFADHLNWWTSFGVTIFDIVNATFVCKFLHVIVLKFTLHTLLYFVFLSCMRMNLCSEIAVVLMKARCGKLE